MTITENEVVLVFFAFMMVFMTFPIGRARTTLTLDLLESSVGACYFLVVVLYSWMQCFPQRLWLIDFKQNIHYDVIEGDVQHITPDMLNYKY